MPCRGRLIVISSSPKNPPEARICGPLLSPRPSILIIDPSSADEAVLPRLDLRHNRAMLITSLVMQVLHKHLPAPIPNRLLGGICEEIEEALRAGDYEVINDDVRRMIGLPPRDGRGWTAEEFIKWEKYRLEMMFKPIVFVPEGVESEKSLMQPGGFIYMRRQIKNRCRLTTVKKRTNEP